MTPFRAFFQPDTSLYNVFYAIGVWIRDVFHCTHYGRRKSKKVVWCVYVCVCSAGDLTIFTGLNSMTEVYSRHSARQPICITPSSVYECRY